jgi:hypothetical protein
MFSFKAMISFFTPQEDEQPNVRANTFRKARNISNPRTQAMREESSDEESDSEYEGEKEGKNYEDEDEEEDADKKWNDTDDNVDENIIVKPLAAPTVHFVAPAPYVFRSLGELLSMLFPACEMQCPDVVLAGAQSSGKTKLVLSLVFSHIGSNLKFSDAMGEALLRILRTGTRMVTRRPTTIRFCKREDVQEFQFELKLGETVTRFGEEAFNQLIDALNNVSGDSAFQEELVVAISGPGLRSIAFTDLAGLVTNDKPLEDCNEKTIKSLAIEYLRRPNTTVVVVEPATLEDFDTSQISPLLR